MGLSALLSALIGRNSDEVAKAAINNKYSPRMSSNVEQGGPYRGPNYVDYADAMKTPGDWENPYYDPTVADGWVPPLKDIFTGKYTRIGRSPQTVADVLHSYLLGK